MPKVKIRHAIATWQDEPDGPVLQAFRGQVVEIPDHEVKRLRVHNAVVHPDLELDRPGVLLELPETPSDEELVAYVMSASSLEVADLIDRRPELAGRVEAAAHRITDERSRMDAHLESVRNAIAGNPSTVIDDDIVMGGLEPATGTESESEQDSSSSAPPEQPRSLSELVQGNAQSVTEYIRSHPDEAQDVLDAETEARDGKPRAAVVAAVQAIQQAPSA